MAKSWGALIVMLLVACSSGSGDGGGAGGADGGGGTGGSGGIDCNSDCASLTACCPGLSTQDCLTGCQQNPNNAPACTACFSNTSCGTLDPCVIANCGLPQNVCYGTP